MSTRTKHKHDYWPWGDTLVNSGWVCKCGAKKSESFMILRNFYTKSIKVIDETLREIRAKYPDLL